MGYSNVSPDFVKERLVAFEAKRAKACVGVLMRILHEDELVVDDPSDLYLKLAQAPQWEPLTQAVFRTNNLLDGVDPR